MAAAPSSPRKDRITALLVMAETVISKTDDEKGNWDWQGRSEVLEVIALLASANRSVQGAQLSDTAPTSSRAEGGTQLARLRSLPPYLGWLRRGRQLTH